MMDAPPAQMGVVVGLPCSRTVMPQWAVALAVQSWPTNINVCYVPIWKVQRDIARASVIDGALQMNAPYVWFIDDDVEIPFSACRQLLKTLKEAPDDVMAVGGIYPSKQNPPEPIVYKANGIGAHWKWKKDTIFDCSLIGTGCMMIKTEVFRRIEKPWFKDFDSPTLKFTDDSWFCNKLIQSGFRILADAHVICTHWDNSTETPYRLSLDSYPFIPAGKEALLSNIPDGWMTGEELGWLADQATKSELIVELGSFLGRSTTVLARATAGRVWALDDFKGLRASVLRADVKAKVEKYQENLYELFKANTEDLKNLDVIQTDHADYSKLPHEWSNGDASKRPDMVFIDGSHEYEDVKRDILEWRKMLRPGGLLCGHDRDWGGVRQALDEVLPGWKEEPGVLWSWQ